MPQDTDNLTFVRLAQAIAFFSSKAGAPIPHAMATTLAYLADRASQVDRKRPLFGFIWRAGPLGPEFPHAELLPHALDDSGVWKRCIHGKYLDHYACALPTPLVAERDLRYLTAKDITYLEAAWRIYTHSGKGGTYELLRLYCPELGREPVSTMSFQFLESQAASDTECAAELAVRLDQLPSWKRFFSRH